MHITALVLPVFVVQVRSITIQKVSPNMGFSNVKFFKTLKNSFCNALNNEISR